MIKIKSHIASFISAVAFLCIATSPISAKGPTIMGETKTLMQKQAEVVALYSAKKYAAANRLIDALLPLLSSNKTQRELHFYQAYCNFHEKHYETSADQFHFFVKHYSTALQVEEAMFMRGYSLSCESIDIPLDQAHTYRAIRFLEHYTATYPTGSYVDSAVNALQRLYERLMVKHLRMARLYFLLGHYKAVIVTLQDFEQTYPGNNFQQEVAQLLDQSHAARAKILHNRKQNKQA